MPKARPDYDEFLVANVRYQGTDCLIWPFRRTKRGYAIVHLDGRDTTASRRMCILAHGEPPKPHYQAAHSCGNGHLGCVAPNHLQWKTPIENATDKIGHGTHLEGEQLPYAKLDSRTAKDIYDDARPQKEIALAYDVSRATVCLIKQGKIWSHATGCQKQPR